MQIDGVIAGLGNPGKEYVGTRHNIGADLLRAFAASNGIEFKSEKFGEVAFIQHDEKIFSLLIPNVFMNRSGEALLQAVNFFNFDNFDNLLVVHDEYTIDLGDLKISYGKSSGGHNGVLSIIKQLKTENFYRLRMGIKPGHKVSDIAKFVLKKFSIMERMKMPNVKAKAEQAIMEFIENGGRRAMNKFN